MRRIRLGAAADFADGAMTRVELDGHELVVARDGTDWFAFPDRCTHARRPLSDGEYADGVVTCCYHGATFDLRRAGEPGMPALRALACHTLELVSDELFVTLD